MLISRVVVVAVVVVVCLLANSVVNCSLLRFSYLQMIIVRLAGGGAYCVATRTACYKCKKQISR